MRGSVKLSANWVAMPFGIDGKQHSFVVCSPSGQASSRYYFAAKTAEEQSSWLASLVSHINYKNTE